MSSIIHDPTSGSSSDTEWTPMIKGYIDNASNNGTVIGFSEKTIINYYLSDPSKFKVPLPADADPTVTENSAQPPQANFSFQPKSPETNEAHSCDTDAEFSTVVISARMKRHLDSLSRAIEKAFLELDGQHSSWHPSPIDTNLPVNSQSESASGNLTFEEEICMLSPKMQNYLNRLRDNQEGTLVDDLERFFRVAFSSGYDNSVMASVLGAFAKDLRTLSPGMQRHITALITNQNGHVAS